MPTETRSVSDIISDAGQTLAESNLGQVFKKYLIAAPTAGVGYAVTGGILALEKLYTIPIRELGLQSGNLIGGTLGNIVSLLNDGAAGTGQWLRSSDWGWIVALVLALVSLWLIDLAIRESDTLSGIDIPLISRFRDGE